MNAITVSRLALVVALATGVAGPAAAQLRDVSATRDGAAARIGLTFATPVVSAEARATTDDAVAVRLEGVQAAAAEWETAESGVVDGFVIEPDAGGVVVRLRAAAPVETVAAAVVGDAAVISLTLRAPSSSAAPAVSPRPAPEARPAPPPARSEPTPVAVADAGLRTDAVAPAEPEATMADPASSSDPEAATAADADLPVLRADAAEPAPARSIEEAAEAIAALAAEDAAGGAAQTVAPGDAALMAEVEAAAMAAAVAETFDAEGYRRTDGEAVFGGDAHHAAPPTQDGEAHPAVIFAGDLEAGPCAAAEAAILADPWDMSRLETYGACLAWDGRSAESREVFERLLTFAPDDPRAHLGLGVARQTAGEVGAARLHYEDALALAATDAQAGKARALLASLGSDAAAR